MKRAAREFAYFLNNRPLCFLSTVFGLRDAIVGMALALGWEWDRTILYANLDNLGGAWLYGILLFIASLFTVVTAIADKTVYTKFGLRFMSWFWLFAAMSYFVGGNPIFGLGALLSSLTSGYIAFYYKYTPLWDEPKKRWRLTHGLPHREEVRV